MLNHFLRKILR